MLVIAASKGAIWQSTRLRVLKLVVGKRGANCVLRYLAIDPIEGSET